MLLENLVLLNFFARISCKRVIQLSFYFCFDMFLACYLYAVVTLEANPPLCRLFLFKHCNSHCV